ncbi:ABC transporter substrate-binding protein [Corynebacterium sp. HMSC05C01]|uniref:ABC transporter family substrate-binding protein n=1 Tax=Corynebacterium coyleae TaxID=53374 RepID=A0AAP6XJM5_9CORY|nr:MULTISPECIES: ABC transporter family substrate-binding protein [Corynebacterium]MDK8800298.1 ABC transporter family substrate-binding protein [Corynebacterium coyleae]MDK8822587.1 ABC transporter family substrate-binding protein [Corynebacterium coyleae]NJJ03759.1 ABC transporter family substrate-binding protein [Corynebacterium coyleae]OFL15143.1 ABC transporter substrate-binding protein [Corynebacterium sp. HMSC067D03]OFO32199.1 ABC transporter substrate-binding protein [Corynebacterium s
MSKRLRVAALAGLSSLSLVLASCSSDGGTEETTANQAGQDSANSKEADNSGEQLEVNAAGDYNPLERDQIQDGGELTLAITEIAEQQNVFHANMTSYTDTIWSKYNPQLTLFDGDGTYHPNPAYLTDVKDETVDGKTVVTYTINPDAVYNDGTPLDWTAFENTFKFNNGSNPDVQVNSTDGYELIESVERGEDDKQAVVTFKQAYPWWEGLFGTLVPPQVKDADTFMNAYLKKVNPEWGAGPFKVENVDFEGGTASFVPNENWWGEKPKLDKITYRQMEDQASLNAFRAGEIDATGVSSRDRLATAKEMGDSIEIRTALNPANYLMTINSTAPGLDDIKVREAIMRGVDREQLAAIRFQGLGYTEDLPGSFNLYQTQPGYEDNFGEVIQYDPEKAKELLKEAGYDESNPLSVRYVTLGDSPMIQATTTALQAMLRNIGIDVQVEERPSSDFSKVVSERDFDLFMSGFRSSDPFGVAYFGQIYKSDSELNKSGTGTPEMDKKIEELQQLPDADEQIKRANELEKEALAQYGIMPYANGPAIVAVKKGLANFGANSFAILPIENVGWAK